MRLLLLFLAVPLIEIALFINVGGAIGLWPTLAIVILTALLGSFMIRRQGLRKLQELRSDFDRLHNPSNNLLEGGMILFAGALLLTPGFFTDAIGFALLTPVIRQPLAAKIAGSFTVVSPHSAQWQDTRYEEDIIDITPKSPSNEPSGWTRK